MKSVEYQAECVAEQRSKYRLGDKYKSAKVCEFCGCHLFSFLFPLTIYFLRDVIYPRLPM